MPRCVSCGATIDDYQAQNYNNHCPDCIRTKQLGKAMYMGPPPELMKFGAGFLLFLGLALIIFGFFMNVSVILAYLGAFFAFITAPLSYMIGVFLQKQKDESRI